MVCSFGSGRMAVMARLLEAESFSPNIAEEVSYRKLAAQNIYRELREADEANLIDGEDMHVFGLKPMADPLHLVCCKACKRPVKASQYAAHAELCRSLITTEESILDVHGGTGHRKPPRKERKKLLTAYANQATPVGEQERSNSIDVDDTSSLSIDVKRSPACVDTASVMDASGVGPQKTDQSACMMPPTKRPKLIAGEHLPISGDLKTTYGVTKILSTQEAHTCKDFPEKIISRSKMVSGSVIVCKNLRQVHERCLQARDVPVPLATKIYYSQRNNRLKSTFSNMYQEASIKELCNDVTIPQVSNQNAIPVQASSQRSPSHKQVDDLLLNQKLESSSVHMPDKVLAQSSELYLGKSGGCLPPTNISNQFQADNVLRPQTTPVGLTRSKYLPKAYPYAGNSGKLLGTMQQPNGSVPVV
ncbi:hypothetical protein LWI28_022667 [Acer negundo]|uniref:SAGA-associated factor 11 n=1 Tax=Acer negundo TaxID=4023 RepID=A0AAD5JN89_ACENE|nr:hypothetical protein LWI28_022667 [Acer negundo]